MINKKDMMIIASLREDARQNLTSLSRKTRVPVSTIFDRIKTHENGTGVINAYTCLVDFDQMGYGMRANILIKVDKKQRNEVADYLEGCKSVNSAYKINSNYDFLAECIFKNLRELDAFIEKLEGQFVITETEVLYVVNEIKRERFLCGTECLVVDEAKKKEKEMVAVTLPA